MKQLPERKPNRLKNYDYSSNGAYFITICVQDMKCVLSTIVGADDLGSPRIRLTEYGSIAERNILKMNEIYPEINIDNFVVMPNHLHILLTIHNNNNCVSGAPRSSPPTNMLSKFVAAFKRFTNKEIGANIWQRGFHDHIIRDGTDYQTRWQYIDENPEKWLLGKDEYYAL